MPSIKFKKLWRRQSVDITQYDPTYKVCYLGNVLTTWAKGDGCIEKPLATLWRNYCQSSRADISMKVTVCNSGLQAVTREHGLTEYWAHRVTYCNAHPAYPKVFCWVYRHEGRKLKQELRCHAVLCSKSSKARELSTQLKERLSLALREFKREKILRQNARLSVVNSLFETSEVPTRRFHLITGASNYRPPLERCKSAPKLSSIEEYTEEEEEEEEGEIRKEREDSGVMEDCLDLEELLNRLRPPSSIITSSTPFVTPASPYYSHQASASPLDVDDDEVNFAIVYEQVREDKSDSQRDIPECSEEQRPAHFFYSSRSTDADECYHLTDNRGVSSIIELHNLGRPPEVELEEKMVYSFVKDPLSSSVGDGGIGNESFTSDQPESIVTNSCSSSSCADDEVVVDVDTLSETGGKFLEEEEGEEGVVCCDSTAAAKTKNTVKVGADEDNISEESGYSEDKDSELPIRV